MGFVKLTEYATRTGVNKETVRQFVVKELGVAKENSPLFGHAIKGSQGRNGMWLLDDDAVAFLDSIYSSSGITVLSPDATYYRDKCEALSDELNSVYRQLNEKNNLLLEIEAKLAIEQAKTRELEEAKQKAEETAPRGFLARLFKL